EDEMPDYSWPPMEKRRVIGKATKRIDGANKSSGRAKYASDFTQKDLLFGALVTCPHAHARVTTIDTSEAEKSPGVTAVRVIASPGTELMWAGQEVASVAANTEEAAKDATRKVKVQYEVLPHLVREDDLSKAGARAKSAGEQVKGDPDKAFQEADATVEGRYGIPVITHCCLEPHGNVIEWKGDHIEFRPSTQNVSGIGGDLSNSLKIPASNIHVNMQYIGGGFGSKFATDLWGLEAARLSKASGGRPVKLFLDRATELMIAGNRPSGFANIKVAGKKDGTITAWQSESWSTGGIGGGGSPPIPYVFDIPNQRKNHTAVSTNCGGVRAWRAPNHQQACYLTNTALEDLAAKLNLDPLEVFDKNLGMTPRAEVYRAQLKKGAELIDWQKLWHPRGQGGSGTMKRGLGLAISTWGGGGHNSQCRTNIHPDGTVEVELCSQDLGTGTRTVITMVAAETLGLPLGAITLKIGDSTLPPSGPSGGSTTVGGVSSSTRKSTVNALDKLFEAVAPALGAPADQLEAVDGRIQVKGNSAKSLTWKAACQKLGVNKISEMGENNQRNPGGLNSSGVGGVQMADVSVDTETGIVKVNKAVAVQDMGLVINPKTAESQIHGGCIMGICAALYEERVMDQQTGKMLNSDMEFYKIAGIRDIGDIIVHLDITPDHDKRGVVGLGEPAAIALITAIANATANAIGVRVPEVPLTPDRVLAALERRNA
ncbi:MAG TPA: xanthine dehydrogenase family protein molybdopterin-binding subunit, partial [Bryobacteraceae bacterium]|nr:xanthine dehydrogenase family protein molybdopterin-binding subunit [Bryobacteraceae bacterium]